jgi:hypothetical protein
VNFTLTASYTGGPSPATFNFQVPTGPPAITISSTLDAIAPAAGPGFTAVTGTQTGRINRLSPASACGTPKPFPGLFTPTGIRRFDAYTIDTCATSAPSCVEVTLTNSATGGNPTLFDVAYIGAFDPKNLKNGYAGDPAASNIAGQPISFAFNLPGGGQPFSIAVHEVNPELGIGDNYSLTVSGACFGACTTPNAVPVAKAKNVTVFADDTCSANASIDDGSSDADGDPLTITQSPPGPYPLGTTPVILTVTDPKGATSQADGTVTVVDNEPPSVSNFSLSAPPLWPPNHRMVDVTVNYELSENCDSASCVLSVTSNEPENELGDGNTDHDWEIVDAHHVRVRAERSGNVDGRVYTVTLTCTDAAGNKTLRTGTLTVPHSR